jgi:hypothetical protein
MFQTTQDNVMILVATFLTFDVCELVHLEQTILEMTFVLFELVKEIHNCPVRNNTLRQYWYRVIFILGNICSRWNEHQWCKSHTFGINFHMSCHSNRSVICTTDVLSNVNRYYYLNLNY